MAQIFVSHSAKDRDLVNFFAKAGATTKVKLVFEELEKLIADSVNTTKIQQDIQFSNAAFILLSGNVERTPYTRDWVVWESGVASSGNKDIWVFEQQVEQGQISVVTPHLRHYVVLAQNDNFLAYIMKVIESYDDSNVLAAAAAGAGAGALMGGPGGAVIGAVGGAILSNKASQRPVGQTILCGKCRSSFQMHHPQGMNMFRCPVCNTWLRLA